MEKILEIKNITKRFPGVTALHDVTLDIYAGEIHALVGENGAGKSTLMKILVGIYQQTEGVILFKGKPMSILDPKEAQKLGISIIHQEFSLVPYLNAYENIFLGKELKRSSGILDRKKMKSQAQKLLDKIGVEVNLDIPVDRLTVAQQQIVEIIKALMENPQVLIMDEPTASLTEGETKKFFELIEKLKADGVTMIFISHHMNEIFEICDRFSCLRDGIFAGTDLVKNVTAKDIVRMMVGRELGDNKYPQKPPYDSIKKNKIILKARNFNRGKYVKNASFELRQGEILGIAGLVGAGRTELIRLLIGADRAQSKQVLLEDKPVAIHSPHQALNYGIGLVPENRKTQGLILEATVKDNITLSNMKKSCGRFGFRKQSDENKIAKKYIDSLNIKTPHLMQKVKNLSGGNQQKVVLAKWMNTDCHILIFDEPTRGIDVGAKYEIHKLMRDLANEGLGIIMISSELPEVLGVSDRVLTVYGGSITGELITDETSQEEIMYYATGGKQNG